MRNIYIIYQKVLKKYPIGTQAVQAGILMGLGDQIAQNFIENDSKTIDFIRTMKFAGIGLFVSMLILNISKVFGEKGKYLEARATFSSQTAFCTKMPQLSIFLSPIFKGPATRTWYGILDKYIGSKGHSVAIKKVACDQLLFAPTFLAVLLVIIGLSQGKDIERLKVKMSNEYSDILINNYKLWPMVQLVNFSLVPLHYQALVVQSVALLWNSYISYRTSLERER